MTIRTLAPDEMTGLRRAFAAVGYTAQGLQAAFGVATPPKRAALPRFLHATRQAEPLALLARVFLGGVAAPVDQACRVWPEQLLKRCQAAGLVTLEEDALRPQVLIVPKGELLFASDALGKLGSVEAREFVLPAGTHAAGYLLDLTVRRPVESTLDLGAGCGEQALFAAAHSTHVVAADISPAATRYAGFNARLNGFDQVECVTGDLFAPVAGRRFDLIVTNPPFVPGPAGAFTYRDAGMELDSLCARIVREAPGHLNDGGFLQMLCEWVEIEGQPWQARLQSWLEGLGCDCWVLHSPPQGPADYAALRLGEVAGGAQTGEEYAAWLRYFEAHRVKAIHPAALILRRRRGRNWLHVQPLSREVRGPAGEAIRRNIEACDFLAGLARLDDLLGVILTPSRELRLEQLHSRESGAWQVAGIRGWLAGALPLDAQLDPSAAVLLREFDGAATTRVCLQRLARQVGDEETEVRRRALPVVRFFVERGFLLRADQ
jgi:methylase of polypeptide subunit release factors